MLKTSSPVNYRFFGGGTEGGSEGKRNLDKINPQQVAMHWQLSQTLFETPPPKKRSRESAPDPQRNEAHRRFDLGCNRPGAPDDCRLGVILGLSLTLSTWSAEQQGQQSGPPAAPPASPGATGPATEA